MIEYFIEVPNTNIKEPVSGFAYEMNLPNEKGWDLQTFDNLVDNVCNAKETYLSNTVRGV